MGTATIIDCHKQSCKCTKESIALHMTFRIKNEYLN